MSTIKAIIDYIIFPLKKCLNVFEAGLKKCFDLTKDIAKRYIYFSTFTSFLLIFSLPFIFTRSCSWTPDFSDSGQIGDTFGIMNPFIAIIAAALTFVAFWTQYCANKEMLKKDAKQEVEHQFYEMLHIHKENVNELKWEQWSILESSNDDPYNNNSVNKYGYHNITGRQVFEFHATEYVIIEYCLFSAITRITKRSKKLHCRISFSPQKTNDLKTIVSISYKIYLEGMSKVISSFFSNKQKIRKYLATLDQAINNSNNNNSSINFCFFERTIPKCKETIFKDKNGYIFLYLYIFLRQFKKKTQNYSSNTNKGSRLMSGADLFTGHYDELNHYYRHLYQTVKTIANHDTNIMPYKEKRKYLKILRAQLTTDEQTLLFYNWISEYGSDWENEKNHFFTTFRMIHNINPAYMEIFKRAGHEKIIQMIKNKNPGYNEYENDNLFEFEDNLN